MTDFDQLLVEGGTPREVADAAVLMAEATLRDPRADDNDRALAQRLLDRGADSIADAVLSQRIFADPEEPDVPIQPAGDVSAQLPAVAQQVVAEYLSPRRASGRAGGMTDPIADFLGRLHSANAAGDAEVVMAASKIKESIAKILRDEGYITDYRVEDARVGVGKSLVVTLKYGPGEQPSIAGLRRVSKPGLRVYAKDTNLARVLGGLGVAIVSTSHGLVTDRQAFKEQLDGEVLAYVW